MFERALKSRLEKVTRSVLILGPRQVGKPTLLASLKPDLTVNLASAAAFLRQKTARGWRSYTRLPLALSLHKEVFYDGQDSSLVAGVYSDRGL